jgi:hypothetical protein
MLQRLVDAAAVEAEIERVRSLSGAALRRRWQAEFGRPLPRGLTIDLLRRMIANRIQEEAFGTLDRATLKLLDGLAGRYGSRPAERNLKIGTVLVRDYQGRRHTVTVEREGYVWEGKPYSSLSAIARAITGTAWSGPRFFALKSAAEPDRGAARRQSQSTSGAEQILPPQSNNGRARCARTLSIGIQSGPRIGIQKGPPFSTF